jgi:pentatricopeptide repeat protein
MLSIQTYRHLIQQRCSSSQQLKQSVYQCNCQRVEQLQRHSAGQFPKRPRTFSTKVSHRHMTKDDSTSELEKWKNMTKDLLEFNYSASDPKTTQLWHQAEACLQFWHKQNDLERCLQILNHLGSKEASLRSIPTESILNPIVKLWRAKLFNHHNVPSVMLPSEMSNKLKRYEECGLVKMDKATHGMILDAASHMEDPNEGVLFGQAYLSDWIERCQENRNDIVKPDAVAIGSVIHAWVESGLPEAPHRADEWMNVCTEFLELQPTTQLYTSVIAAWAKVGKSQRAQDWMDRMDKNDVNIDLAAWNGLLLAYAHSAASISSQSESPAQRAEGVLKHMLRLYDTKKLAEAPDVVSYSIVLDAWSKQVSRDSNARQKKQSAHKALQLLQQMKESLNPNVSPNTISYNSVLTTCARAGLVPEAESLLKEMIQEYIQQNSTANETRKDKSTIQPDIQSVALLLHAYSRTTMDTMFAAQKAESILKDSLPSLGLEPNLQIYNNCISCWAKASSPKSSIPVERATALFREISQLHGMQPDVVAYTALMNVWGRHGKAEEAQALLDELWKVYQDARSADSHLYKPTAQTLTTVLHAWSSCNPEQTEALLQRMAQDYGVSPNVFSYSVVLTAWAKHASSKQYPDAPDRAFAILNGMMEYGGIRPNVVSYSTVIQAFGEQGRAKEAEALLEKMLSSTGGMTIPKPDMYAFSSVLYAWSKSRNPHAAERAEAILVRMLQLYLSGELDQPPNVYCYTNVLLSLAHSKKAGSADRALQILRSMQQNHAEASETMAAPNLISYNTVINAFANEIGRVAARDDVDLMMEQVFDLLQELISLEETNPRLRPDEWTYISVCKAIQNVRTRRNNMRHVNRLLTIMNEEGFEPTRDMQKKIRLLMR